MKFEVMGIRDTRDNKRLQRILRLSLQEDRTSISKRVREGVWEHADC
jgi:hypothetical protein